MSTRLSRSLIGLFLLASIVVGFLVFAPSPLAPQDAGEWQVTAANRSHTGEEKNVPALGSNLKPGQRIETARGQNVEFCIGQNRIALKPNTVVIAGDDDPGTEIGTFELVSGRISVTVPKDEFATVDAPGSKPAAMAPISMLPHSRRIRRSPSSMAS
jgi:hypothetical protein